MCENLQEKINDIEQLIRSFRNVGVDDNDLQNISDHGCNHMWITDRTDRQGKHDEQEGGR